MNNQDKYHKEGLIHEYDGLSTLINNGWTIAYTVLGGGIAIFGVLIDKILNINSKNDYVMIFVYSICLLLLPIILTMIIGQITRASYIFSFRLSDIAKDLNIESNFWQIWHR